jgi:hypothetical protein
MYGMAGEVGHVVYAARLLTWLGDAVKHPSYWAGTLFPDIRHLGVTSRRRTHPANVSLQSLPGHNDFLTGMRVHAWVDAIREQFFREQNTKESLPWHPFVPHAIKLVEDELLYDRYEDWNLIHRVLNQTYDDELQFVQSKEHIYQWHTVLQDYLRQKPTNASRKELSIAIGLSANSADEINSIVDLLRSDRKATKLLDKFLKHLEVMLR